MCLWNDPYLWSGSSAFFPVGPTTISPPYAFTESTFSFEHFGTDCRVPLAVAPRAGLLLECFAAVLGEQGAVFVPGLCHGGSPPAEFTHELLVLAAIGGLDIRHVVLGAPGCVAIA